jgi:uncharacterized protein
LTGPLVLLEKLKHAEGGHDWFHIERVYKNALLIAKEEVCNETIVSGFAPRYSRQ